MTRLTDNDGREFTVTRTPQVESAGYPCLFSVTLDGHTIQRVTKSGLKAMKAEIKPSTQGLEMNTKDYGQHASGYRRPGPDELSRGFAFRLVFWALVFAVCVGWVMTHTGCAHPIGNGLAALMGFGLVPLRLLCLVLSEAGVE